MGIMEKRKLLFRVERLGAPQMETPQGPPTLPREMLTVKLDFLTAEQGLRCQPHEPVEREFAFKLNS